MRLNEENRRRALKRRRKLMPEPRRISANQTAPSETSVLREVPAGRKSDRTERDFDRVEQPEADTAVIQT
jgi:hypothetical protein